MSTVFEVERRPTARPVGRPRARRFGRDEIIAAIQAWTAEHGAPPLTIDWEPSRARARGQVWRAERFERGTWPTIRMVRRQFRTLGEAIAAAGLEPPRPRGRKPNLTGPDAVLRAIREWTRRFGEPPTQTDLDPYRARRTRQEWRIERYYEGDWPSLPTVRHHFGTLSAAVAAAGLEPAPQSETPADRLARRRRNRLALVDGVAGAAPDHGPGALAAAVREVARARSARDAQALDQALLELAGTALGWADRVRG
ncbi:hypothetical protein [Paraconexibacter algicola]|uniref:Uncharacterized protein n=1 Tax=Paraconexibacter algicola TaxID=2133960 RepID=A0A2T4UGB1_9ACTN|nr:hypothetical protein [Paraconexibacter algicola]PTL58239.1 hypothetical protein C7Y72_00535 [Paraconexibacter algicola]